MSINWKQINNRFNSSKHNNTISNNSFFNAISSNSESNLVGIKTKYLYGNENLNTYIGNNTNNGLVFKADTTNINHTINDNSTNLITFQNGKAGIGYINNNSLDGAFIGSTTGNKIILYSSDNNNFIPDLDRSIIVDESGNLAIHVLRTEEYTDIITNEIKRYALQVDGSIKVKGNFIVDGSLISQDITDTSGDVLIGGAMYVFGDEGTGTVTNEIGNTINVTDFYDNNKNNNDHGRLWVFRNAYFLSNVDISGDLNIYTIVDNSNNNNKISFASDNLLQYQTEFGKIFIGCNNTDYAHFETDRAKFWFDKTVSFNQNIEMYTSGLVIDQNRNIYANSILVNTTTPNGNKMNVQGNAVINGTLDIKNLDINGSNFTDQNRNIYANSILVNTNTADGKKMNVQGNALIGGNLDLQSIDINGENVIDSNKNVYVNDISANDISVNNISANDIYSTQLNTNTLLLNNSNASIIDTKSISFGNISGYGNNNYIWIAKVPVSTPNCSSTFYIEYDQAGVHHKIVFNIINVYNNPSLSILNNHTWTATQAFLNIRLQYANDHDFDNNIYGTMWLSVQVLQSSNSRSLRVTKVGDGIQHSTLGISLEPPSDVVLTDIITYNINKDVGLSSSKDISGNNIYGNIFYGSGEGLTDISQNSVLNLVSDLQTINNSIDTINTTLDTKLNVDSSNTDVSFNNLDISGNLSAKTLLVNSNDLEGRQMNVQGNAIINGTLDLQNLDINGINVIDSDRSIQNIVDIELRNNTRITQDLSYLYLQSDERIVCSRYFTGDVQDLYARNIYSNGILTLGYNQQKFVVTSIADITLSSTEIKNNVINMFSYQYNTSNSITIDISINDSTDIIDNTITQLQFINLNTGKFTLTIKVSTPSNNGKLYYGGNQYGGINNYNFSGYYIVLENLGEYFPCSIELVKLTENIYIIRNYTGYIVIN